MTTFTSPTDAPDADLVARSLKGDSDAYAAIVERYQSLICSLTYAACGDLHQSQDLAQETFLAARQRLSRGRAMLAARLEHLLARVPSPVLALRLPGDPPRFHRHSSHPHLHLPRPRLHSGRHRHSSRRRHALIPTFLVLRRARRLRSTSNSI